MFQQAPAPTNFADVFFPNNWSSPPLPPPPPPQTQMHESTGHLIVVVIDEEDEEVTKPSTAAKLSAAIKSSVDVDERKLAAKPSTTGVAVKFTDKEKRVKNKKIRAEVLQKMLQFKAVLGVPFGTEHWKELLSQMENVGDYTHQLFFGCQGWRAHTF